ncbi:regulator of G-protein signaling 4-like [Planoprotostelium fungivorum]|uniref:Regulator of G-protein signaling 4-like n=1 Tax=Planoprotostelium fungivorum TaxID=1890364 RepID=A0A2P6NDN2_9EUKA|nr:regulator of G-protein signaling 4-like [Planoprotostelium fungivorum]
MPQPETASPPQLTLDNPPRLDEILGDVSGRTTSVLCNDKRVLIRLEELYDLFVIFLRRTFSVENLDCYRELISFQSAAGEMTTEERGKRAKLIYDTFISSDAETQVNVDSETRKSMSARILDAENLKSDAFNEVSAAVLNLLTMDSFPKFIKSVEYRQYIEELYKQALKEKDYRETAAYGKEITHRSSSGSGTDQGLSILKILRGSRKSLPEVERLTTQHEVDLLQCKEKCNRILKMLREADADCSEEYTVAMTSVYNGLDMLERLKAGVPDHLLKDLRLAIRDYHMFVDNLQSSGVLASVLNTYRSTYRMKITSYNLNAYRKYQTLNDESEDSNDSPLYSPTSASSIGFWKLYFGTQIELTRLTQLYINWKSFVHSLAEFLNITIRPDIESILKFLLDNSNLDVVNRTVFESFLHFFGPIRTSNGNCVEQVKGMFQCKWFYGYLSKNEAALLLADTWPGTFLCRISKGQTTPGAMEINYTDSKKRFCQFFVSSTMDGVILTDSHGKEKRYTNITEAIRSNGDIFKNSLLTTIPFESWFWGDISLQEAADSLLGQPDKTFLIRTVIESTSFAVTWVVEGRIKNSLIKRDSKGWQLASDENGKSYTDLYSLIVHYRKTLQKPFVSPASLILVSDPKTEKSESKSEQKIELPA